VNVWGLSFFLAPRPAFARSETNSIATVCLGLRCRGRSSSLASDV